MEFQLWRNATLLITVNGKRILVDPMLGEKGSLGRLPMVKDERLNPLTSLPFTWKDLLVQLKNIDLILVSHLHPDHWDPKAIELLDKEIPVICGAAFADPIIGAGFKNVQTFSNELIFEDITINLTGGQHGTGEIGNQMGTVHGFVLSYGGETLYIAGDTIWCQEVKLAIDMYHPDQIIVNGGAARFDMGDPITMSIEDIINTCMYAPKAKVYVVHLETLGHCTENRDLIRQALAKQGLNNRCMVPDDGETLN